MTPDVIGIGWAIIAAALAGFIANHFRQPIIPAYIVGGVVIGPLGLRLVHEPSAIRTLAELTIVFVMFVIGLEMDVRRIKAVGTVVTIGGILQVVLTTVLGLGLSLLWFDFTTSVYLGLLLAFGSTMLVVRLLSDRRQLDTLHGRIALGILLLQDILAIIALSFLTAKGFSSEIVVGTVIKAIGLMTVAILAGQYLFPPIFRKVAESAELLTLASLAVGFGFGFLAESQGLSASIGAFITGVSLANLPYQLELIGRVKALRDFFMPIFFISLGLQIAIPTVQIVWPLIVLTCACAVLKPGLISVLIAAFGYRKRTSFLVSNALLSISEFGLVIVAMGVRLGQIKPEILTLAIILMTFSMIISSYLFGEKVYPMFTNILSFLDHFGPKIKEEDQLGSNGSVEFDTIMVGCHQTGRYFIDGFGEKRKFKIIEISPERLDTLRELNIPCVYGDAGDAEVWEHLGDLTHVKNVISTVPDAQQNRYILSYLKRHWPQIEVLLTADGEDEAAMLYEAGADFVICPNLIAGRKISEGTLEGVFDPEQCKVERTRDIEHLSETVKRWRLGRSKRH